MRSFEAGARRWLGSIAKGLERPAFERLHPSFVADVALTAYAGHESSYFGNIIGTFDRPQNHDALRSENNDPCWAMINQAPPDPNDVCPEEPVTVSTTDERIKVYSGLAVGYLKGRIEFAPELAQLTARYFAGLGPAEIALVGSLMGEDLLQHFGFGDTEGFVNLSALGASGKTVADLGMGTHAIIYQNTNRMPAKITLIDNNPFTVEFNRTYVELTGRVNIYNVGDTDMTLDPKTSGIAPESIGHAGSKLLTHHIFDDKGVDGLESFSRFLWYILQKSGTFRIIDHAEKKPFAADLAGILRSTGFSLEEGKARCLSRFWPHDQNTPFIIDGRK